MNFADLNGLVWFIACLVPLIFVKRKLHWELQALFLLLTRHPSISLGLFSFLFFPGVFLHELSHYLMARLLGVRTGRFSLLPQLLPDGRLRLGYVETAQSDPLRDSLIGTAPLITGGAVIAYLAISRLGFPPLIQEVANGQWDTLSQALLVLPERSDFWLWFYLAFAISSTMLPSASDRQSWLPLGLVILFLASVAILIGAGPWMMLNLAPWLNTLFKALAMVFGTSLVMHAVLLIPAWLARVLLGRIIGVQVVE